MTGYFFTLHDFQMLSYANSNFCFHVPKRQRKSLSVFTLATPLFSIAETGSCPIGWKLNQCGSLCQRTCEDYVAGARQACILICAPPDCVCPQGMVVFRDRCVDPLECYSLLTSQLSLQSPKQSGDCVLLFSLLCKMNQT